MGSTPSPRARRDGPQLPPFGDSATEALFHGESGKAVRRILSDIRSVAVRKLDIVNAASVLDDLRVPPGNRREAVSSSGSTNSSAASGE